MDTKWIYLLILAMSGTSCIDELDLDRGFSGPEPVIEGVVANQPGASFVRISSTMGVSNSQIPSEISTIGNEAQVFVEESSGTRINFCEERDGFYVPEVLDFFAREEYEYKLNVILSDGRSFESASEAIESQVNIDSLFFVFEQFEDPETLQLTGNHLFFVTATTDSQDSVFFRTVSNGIAQVAARVERPISSFCGAPCIEFCWSFREPVNRRVALGSVDPSFTSRFTLEVANQPYDFQSLYFIRVELYSLSRAGFNFWNSLSKQLELEGSIFDPQISEVEGANVFNSEGEAILGYFGASTVSTDSLLFNRFESAGFRTIIPRAPFACTGAWTNATEERPPQFDF